MKKDIVGYESLYSIDIKGTIRKEPSGKIISWIYGDRGYATIGLTKNGKRKGFRVHRLVAQTFIENPKELPQVDHIDENKTNNNKDNLRWCTNKENSTWFYENNPKIIKSSNNKKQIVVDGDIFESAYAAAKYIVSENPGKPIKTISKELRRRHFKQGTCWIMYKKHTIGY